MQEIAVTATGPVLSPQILGLAENTHRAILNRLLDETGLTYSLWAIFLVTALAGDVVDRELVVDRVATALKVEAGEVLKAIDSLAASGLLKLTLGDRFQLQLTETGGALFRDLRGKVDEIVSRLYAGIPQEDLAVAGRILALVIQRANAELAALPRRST